MRKGTIALFICAFAVMVMATVSPSAYAAGMMVHSEPGTSEPGCEETNTCFMPYQASILVGDRIVFMNVDSAAHTFSSGTPQEGPNGLFDSGLVSPGGSFLHTFDEAGEYPYFCLVHPWMVGAVIVEAVAQEPMGGAGASIEMVVEPELPDAGEEAKLTFVGKTSDGEIWDHIDFRIIVQRGGEEIFNHEFHTHAGVLELEILPEATDFTIEIPEEESEHEEEEEVHEGEEHEEESLPPVDTTIEPGEGEYIIKGPLFLDKADYTITAQIIGIEFKPLPPDAVVTQEFGVQVIPEFPLALLPMVFGFVAMISILRFKNKLHSL